MFPKKGKRFPTRNDRVNRGADHAAMIAEALRAELGDTHRAAKTLMRWTGASERTVKHWLAGRHAPGGDHLIVLMRESEAVLETVLTAAGHRDAFVAARVLAAQDTMVEVMAMVEREFGRQVHDDSLAPDWPRVRGPGAADDRVNDRVSDPVSLPREGLNPRQQWYLQALASGDDVRAVDLQRRWGISEKTARRDVAALKARGMIEFVGPFRTGRYRCNR